MARRIDRKRESKRAAIYARVSDKRQAEEDKTSISEQIVEMEAHCERRGLSIVARYEEVGRGWTKNRPEFQRMLADAALGRFDTIVCWKSDRLSRGMYPAAALMEVVEAHQIDLEAVMDAIDIKTFGLMAAIGKIELDNFRERASMGKRGAAKQGRIPVGSVPYGYRRRDDGKPCVHEPEAEIVRRIFQLCINGGLGTQLIAMQLTAEGERSWHDGSVHRILRNEAYRGTWWYGKARYVTTERGKRVHKQSRDGWIGIPFPAIIDDETWDRAQALMKQRRTRSSRNTKIFYLLQHMVRCSECGMLMGCMSTTKRRTVRSNGKVYRYERKTPLRYYKCYGMQRHRMECRERSMIRAERLEELIWNEVRHVLRNPELILADIESLESREDGALVEKTSSAERDLDRIQSEEDRAIRLYVLGKITEDQLDLQRRFISERMEVLQARVDNYRGREQAKAQRMSLGKQIEAWAAKVGSKLDDLTDDERREMLRLLLDEATIDRDNSLTLTLAVPTGDLIATEPWGTAIRSGGAASTPRSCPRLRCSATMRTGSPPWRSTTPSTGCRARRCSATGVRRLLIASPLL